MIRVHCPALLHQAVYPDLFFFIVYLIIGKSYHTHTLNKTAP